MKKLTRKIFIQRSILKHGNIYNYSHVEYVNNSTKVCIICPKHGGFWQVPYDHMNGRGCKLCGTVNASTKNSSTIIEFIKKSEYIHGNKYDYSKVIYVNNTTHVCIICHEHGEFWQVPSGHLKGHGCPQCNSSHGERDTHRWLTEHDIKHEIEYTYDGLVGVGGGLLKFDFFLPDHNICIEYDGEQHYIHKYTWMTKQSFINLQEHDKRKNEYCDKHNIHLIRIRYNDNINDVLLKVIT